MLTLVLLLLLGLGALAWRVAETPLSLGTLLQRAAVLPDGVAVGNTSLAWAGWRGGPDAPVKVRAQGVSAASLPGVTALRLDEGTVALAVPPLLHRIIAPVSIDIAGLDARVSPAEGEGTELPVQLDLSQLRSVHVRDARVASESSGLAWNAEVAAAGVSQAPDGAATGDLTGALTVGTVSAPVQARLTRAPDGALHVEGKAGELRPTALAASIGTAAPMLGGLAALDAPVRLIASADLSAALNPVRATVQATIGAGTAALAGGTIPIRDAAGEVALTWQGEALHGMTLSRLDATIPSPSGAPPTALHLAAAATRAGAGWRVQGQVGFDHVAAVDLPQLWPPEAIRNARRWVVENITAGTARAGQFAATLDVPADPSDTKLAAISGSFQGDDLTIHWLRPVPPVEHVQATLQFVDPDTIRIPVSGGQQGSLRVKGGMILLTGLAGRDQYADVSLNLAGPLAGAVTLLSHPRLRLLSKRPLPFTVAAGQLAGTVDVRLPLIADLDADAVASNAHARLSGVVLRNVVAGRDLSRGTMDLDVTNEGLHLAGQAQLAGVPTRLTVGADFRAGPPSQVLLTVDATGRVTAAVLQREGLDVRGALTGAAQVAVRYTVERDKDDQVTVRADMGEAAVSTPLWRKPGGAPASASARIALRGDRVIAVEELHAEGPGLLVSGRAEMAEGRPAVLKLDRVVLERTQAAGEIRLPPACGGAVCVRLSGPTLDLSTGLGRIAQAQGQPGRGAALPWRVDARFGRVLLDESHSLGPVRADARSDGKRLVAASLDAPGVQGSLRTQGKERVAALRAADLGSLLRGIGTTDLLHGGRLSFDGRFDDTLPTSPFTGTAELDDFTVQRAVVAGKLLQAFTLYGILDAIRGPGLFFSRAVVPMQYVGNVLTVQQARAYSAALGVTAQGWLDLARSTLDLRGTIVPAYVVNSALGRLPLIGHLFSPERGGGLIAANFSLRGRLDDPSVTVNPLSALTPGFLRGVFSIFQVGASHGPACDHLRHLRHARGLARQPDRVVRRLGRGARGFGRLARPRRRLAGRIRAEHEPGAPRRAAVDAAGPAAAGIVGPARAALRPRPRRRGTRSPDLALAPPPPLAGQRPRPRPPAPPLPGGTTQQRQHGAARRPRALRRAVVRYDLRRRRVRALQAGPGDLPRRLPPALGAASLRDDVRGPQRRPRRRALPRPAHRVHRPPGRARPGADDRPRARPGLGRGGRERGGAG